MIRSTVVVDPDGKVELAKYNVKATGHVAIAAEGTGGLTAGSRCPRQESNLHWSGLKPDASALGYAGLPGQYRSPAVLAHAFGVRTPSIR